MGASAQSSASNRATPRVCRRSPRNTRVRAFTGVSGSGGCSTSIISATVISSGAFSNLVEGTTWRFPTKASRSFGPIPSST